MTAVAAEQLPLALDDLGPEWRSRSIEEQFAEFDRRNPHVKARLYAMTRDLVARGHRKVGVKMLFEVLRWRWAMETDDPSSAFKLNNNYTAYYARVLVREHPELDGVFEIRRSAADHHA